MPLAFSGGVGISWTGGPKTWTTIENNHEEFNDPELTGPDRLCNVFGSVIGDFFGGGNPQTDIYTWEILGPSGQSLFKGSGGGGFQTISYTFGLLGTHRVDLKVSRGGQPLGSFSKNVELVEGPKISLKSSYVICENQEIELSAIDPSSSNFSNYTFEWKNEFGVIIGTENTLKTSTPGNYSVVFLFTNSQGNPECQTTISTEVSNSESYLIASSSLNVCPDGSITFSSVPEAEGEWFVQKSGEPAIKSLGKGKTKTISPNTDLSGPGDYDILFVVPNENNLTCTQEFKKSFFFNPSPEFEFESAIAASACLVPDGAIRIKALTPIDILTVDKSGQSFGPLNPGDIVEFPGLKSGNYTILGFLGECSNSISSVVPLVNPPPQLEFELSDIQSEICTDTGKQNGSFLIKLINGVLEGSYRIKNQKGSVIRNEALPLTDEFRIEIPGGKYFFEILNKDSCNLPKNEEFEIPSLTQVEFSVPEIISICQSFEFTPETSEALDFTITYPDLTTETILAGDSFTLTQEGKHVLVGRLPGQLEICPTQKEFSVTLVDPVDFEPVLIEQDCFGNITYKAEIGTIDPNSVLFRWLNQLNEVVGTGQFLNPTSYGLFKLDVQPANSPACPIPPKEFLIKEPILSVDVKLEATKLCEYGPRAIISLSTSFFEEVTDIEWRRYDDLGNIENLPQFNDSSQITVDQEGTYEAAVFSRIPSIKKDCELGRNTIKVDLVPNKVTFDIPGDLSICEPISLIPQSSQALDYLLTYPDGKEVSKKWNEEFILDQAGTYTLLGFDPDIKGPLCPEQKTFVVKINPPVQFQPSLVTLTCEGVYEYVANVSNYRPDEVDYFWRDETGNLLGSEATFFTSANGSFSLEVQPKGSLPCSGQQIIFEVPVPILSVDTQIKAGPLCPDQPDAALEVIADLDPVQTIEWWYTDLSNNRSQLTNQTNKTEILASEEGTYEVRLFNEFGCFLGQDQTLVIRSTDEIRPVVEDSYQICPRYDIAPSINPGNFAQYEWYFSNTLVSTSPTFKPSQIGLYSLIVYNEEGCAFQTSFLTEEECELEVSFPNAIQPGNPEKPFLIYTNYLVDELEVWIFSRWGEVIFYCKKTDLITKESTCIWDGYFRDEKVLPGSYAYRMNYKNLEKNISKEELGAILVID